MACLTAAERAAIEADIATKEAQLVTANATYSELLTKINKEYRFNSNEGWQQAVKQDVDAIRSQIEWLEACLRQLRARLRGQSLTNMNLRRRRPIFRYRSYPW